MLGLAGCTDQAPPPEPAAEAHFVGTAVCAGCHTEEAERWSGSYHDLAMQPATSETVLGDFDDATLTYHGITTRFYTRDGEFFVRTDGPDGALHDYRIAYTFGVEPLQQYLVEMPNGRYQAFGIAWDSRPAEQGGQRWFHLYPDLELDASDPLHWTQSVHNWNGRCATCHSTALEKRYIPDEDRFATRWSEIDVGCEACHGPGSLHAAAPEDVQAGLPSTERVWRRGEGAATAARSGTESGAGEIDVCAQCHARRAQLDDALAPGEPLLDRFVPARLDEGLYHADGQILDEVFVYGSFVQSAMYRAGVVCSDCHDPHSTRVVAEGNALCTRCHAPNVFDTAEHHHHAPGGPGAMCVDCHMRAETYMIVDPRRDHSFRVPRPDLSASLGTPNPCGDCHRDEGADWAAARVREWFPGGRSSTFHYGQALAAGRAWSADRAALLARVITDAEQPAIARATAVRHLAEQVDGDAVELITRALDDEEPLVQLAALEALESLPADRRAALGQRFLSHPLRALRITAARVLAPVRMDLSARRQADLDAALNEYVAVQRFNADTAEARFNLAALDAVLGNTRDAEAAYRRVIEREPAFAPAYANLADLYRSLGREADAEGVLREGIDANPEAAALHYALGLSLARSARIDEAIAALERAAALEPGEPLYGYALGLARVSAGEREQAIEQLEATSRASPGYVPALFALATLYRDAGDVEAALRYTRDALAVSPSDPGARALLAELEAARSSR
ncbi:MAG TPA: tetratricopeptide repeat protein [Gammaproteobacteria bacterium]